MTWDEFCQKYNVAPCWDLYVFGYDDTEEDFVPISARVSAISKLNEFKCWYIPGWRDERAEMRKAYPHVTDIDQLKEGATVLYLAKGGNRGIASWDGRRLIPEGCGQGAYWLDRADMRHYLKYGILTFWVDVDTSIPKRSENGSLGDGGLDKNKAE